MVQRSPNQQQHHNNNNHTRKFGQNTKTLKLAKVGLAKVGQDHDWPKSVWPKSAMTCNSQSPSSLDFLHFQHLCCVHHMEAPAGMICSSPQSFASSFSVPCCRQRIHYECLARRPLPFLHTGLRPRPDPLLAAFEHLDIPIDFNAPLSIHSTLSVSLNATLPFSPSVVPTFVDLLIGWNGLPFTLLPKVPLLYGFFNGSVAPASRPRPCRTSLLCPQSRVDALCCVSWPSFQHVCCHCCCRCGS